MKIDLIFEKLWKQYTQLNPQAEKIHALLKARGETVLNDHVAFRTYNLAEVGIEKLAKVFKKNGYIPKGEYHFEEKKLYAIHMEHENKILPKVFISELLVNKFSNEAQKIIKDLVQQVSKSQIEQDDFCMSGRLWKTTHKTYESLLKESEYAAWMSAFGFCANHFTVNVNNLKTFPTLADLNSFLKQNGFPLNASGGEIKGSKDVFLEQSSTLAGKTAVSFEDGTFEIPTCYYEFAKRYPLANGELYQGFVEKSADKIFESTDRKLQM